MSKKLPRDVKKKLGPGEKPAPKVNLDLARKKAFASPSPEEWEKMSPAEQGLMMKYTGDKPPAGMGDTSPDFIPDDSAADFIADEETPDFIPDEAAEEPWYSVDTKGLMKGAVEALPMAGAMFGGVAGTPLGPIGMVGGAGLGAAGGKAVENFVEKNFMGEPKTYAEVFGDPVTEGVKGAMAEAGGQVVGQGIKNFMNLGEASTPITTQTMPVPKPPAEQIFIPPAAPLVTFRERGFLPKPKHNASEIEHSTRAIGGGRATPGMLSANPNVQNLESILSQSPTMAGEKVRQSYQPIFEGLQNTARETARHTPMSPHQAGTQVKERLASRIRDRAAPLKKEFNTIRESTPHINPDPKSLNRSADRLLKQPMAEVDGLPQTQAIKKYAEMIRGARSLDTLKQIRTGANEELTQALMQGRGQEARALTKVKNAITRLERREIIKAAQAAMPTKLQGDKAAKALIDQMKATNRGWAVMMRELESIAKAGKLGRRVGSPEHMIRIIEEMPEEQLAKKLFDTKNYSGLLDIKKFAPDEFEILRQAKLTEIANKSMTDGVIDPRKLIRNMEAEGPEARGILFGSKGEAALRDLKNVLYSIPKKVGASDTPRGTMWDRFANDFWNIINPVVYGREVVSGYNWLLLHSGKAASLRQAPSQLTRGLLSRPVTTSGGLLLQRGGGRESEE